LKVLHVTDSFSPGGVSNVILDLTSARAPEWEITLASFRAGPWDERAKDVAPLVVGLPSLIHAMRQADIVHTHHRRAGLLANVLVGKHKVIEHVHNVFLDHTLTSFRGQTIVAVSEAIREHTESRYPRTQGKVETIRNGIQAPSLRFTAAREGDYVVGVGRLELQKDPLKFLDLAHLLHDRYGTSSVWIGDGSLRDDFTAKRDNLGLVEVVTWIPDASREIVMQELSGAVSLLVTSRWEGLPLVALEAMSLGIPVATTNCGDLHQIIVKSEAGVVLTGDSAVDTESIGSLLDEFAWKRASIRARNLFESDFDIEQTITKWRHLYDEICRKS
jgi:glycosyltransferase involved in cell wall biosynthesis